MFNIKANYFILINDPNLEDTTLGLWLKKSKNKKMSFLKRNVNYFLFIKKKSKLLFNRMKCNLQPNIYIYIYIK